MKDFLTQTPDELLALASDIDRILESLPLEERQAYEDARQSVIDARRSANANEGRMVLP